MAGLLGYLEQLQAKPEAQRRRLALAIALGGTLLVLVLWFANLRFLLSVEAGFAPGRELAERSAANTAAVNLGDSVGPLDRVRVGWYKFLEYVQAR